MNRNIIGNFIMEDGDVKNVQFHNKDVPLFYYIPEIIDRDNIMVYSQVTMKVFVMFDSLC